ncbi:ISAs1 family transposase [Tessaracoccus caeni]|uniref:ISAs1 family transposase n=1 Tax=Tessaracoccus caeni TaxID=3031239 RepID=UPI0023DB5E95|nr:ISAs1 family transposase [Tessaracoccus caeni]MDF1490414.1 ISAs1 family transposase [Tessaracoccus caeni]
MTSSPVTACAVEPKVLRAAQLSQLFTYVPDPRKARGRRHRLPVILALAVAAVATGAKSIYAIADYAADTGIGLLVQLGYPASIVSEATFRRVIEALDAETFSLICGAWLRLRAQTIAGRLVIALDGKTVRGARAGDARAPHLVAACTHADGVVLGQTQVDDKSNEIPATRHLLGMMNLTGVVVTMDAMHTQTETAQQIIDQHGDYLLTVKANQPSLHRALKALPWKHIPSVAQRDLSHGRRVTRTTQAVVAPAWISFPGARQVAKVRRVRTVKGNKTVEVVYLISSTPMTDAQPAVIAAWAQGHWAIENKIHYVRDVTFDEDRSRLRTGNGPAMMAALRNLVISLHRYTGATNIAKALRHTARHPDRALKLLLTT